MRIAFIGAEGVPYPNAFAKITEEIGARLVDRGHEVLVYGRHRMAPDSTPFRGMSRVPLPSWNSKHLDTITFSAVSVAHLLRSGWADIAHIHGIGPSVFARFPRLRRIKTVVHFHALDWQRAKWGPFARRYLRFSEAAAVRFPDATITVSQGLKKYLEGKYGREVFYVPQGVDTANAPAPLEILELGVRPHEYMLFMARLVPEKGLHHALDAYGRLLDDRAGVNSVPPLIVAGDGAHSDSYVNDVKRLAPPGVRFLGHVSGRLKEELLGHASLFIQPSEIEGLSLGLIEAMSYGTAVLASDIPENVEAAGDSAKYFRSGDPSDFAAQLASMLRSPETMKELGAAAARFAASRYSWDLVTTETERVYHKLLQPEPGVAQVGERKAP